MRKTIRITLVALLALALAGFALAGSSKKACKQNCEAQKDRVFEMCQKRHQPGDKGKCMKIAASWLADCQKACNDAAKD